MRVRATVTLRDRGRLNTYTFQETYEAGFFYAALLAEMDAEEANPGSDVTAITLEDVDE